MKIGIVSEYHYPTIGGIQEHIHFFHRELLRLGHDVVVFTPKVDDVNVPVGERVADPGRVLRFGKSRILPANGSSSRVSTGWNLARDFSRALADEKCDLLHLHSPFAPTLPLLALKEATVPVVGTFHTNIVSEGDGFIKRFIPLMREYLKRLDVRIAVSETAAEAMRHNFGGEYRIIPNGVDVEGFQAGKPYADYVDDKVNLLFVGRLDPRNGLDDMIAAAELASKRTPLRLIVMGDGPSRPRYEAIGKKALGDDVIFLGTRCRTRPDWYATADILCAPIKVATFGIVLTEAMAAGLPIVANRIAGFSDVMTDGREGVFVDTENTEAFASKLVDVARNELLRKRLGDAGRKTVKRYDWRNVTKSVVDVYKETLASRPVLNRSA